MSALSKDEDTKDDQVRKEVVKCPRKRMLFFTTDGPMEFEELN